MDLSPRKLAGVLLLACGLGCSEAETDAVTPPTVQAGSGAARRETFQRDESPGARALRTALDFGDFEVARELLKKLETKLGVEGLLLQARLSALQGKHLEVLRWVEKARAQSPADPVIFATPGNPGTSVLAQNVDLDPLVPDDIVGFCLREAIDLVIIGPEDPLIAGLADHLHKAGFAVFGPGAQGARLEGDKEFAKEVLASAGVPTPHHHAFSSSRAALKHLDNTDLPVVIKACGAAQGKGVAVCSNREEAESFIRECLDNQRFGGAGLRILIEDCIFGPELSVLVVTDGQS